MPLVKNVNLWRESLKKKKVQDATFETSENGELVIKQNGKAIGHQG